MRAVRKSTFAGVYAMISTLVALPPAVATSNWMFQRPFIAVTTLRLALVEPVESVFGTVMLNTGTARAPNRSNKRFLSRKSRTEVLDGTFETVTEVLGINIALIVSSTIGPFDRVRTCRLRFMNDPAVTSSKALVGSVPTSEMELGTG